MPTIHLVDGEKGGIGKSLFCKCLNHYFESHKIDYILIDADPNNPDVAEVYDGITNIHFKASDEATAMNSKSSAKVDQIFEMAFANPVLVNLPANIHQQVAYWILDNNLLDGEIVTKAEVKICKWFLSNGSYNSINLFLNSLNTFEGKLPHCFVRNYGICLDWTTVDEREEFKQAKSKYEFGDIGFPGLRATERDYLEENRVPFSLALEDSGLPILSRQRLTKFLRQTIDEIEQSGLLALSQTEAQSA